MRRLILLLTACLLSLAASAQSQDTTFFSLPLRRLQLTSSFGYRIHPLSRLWQRHGGIDLSARSDKVFCVLAGVVEKTAYDPALGIYVRVRHSNELLTTYGHLSRPWVSFGDKLSAGQPIGITGATGRVTGEHLHFAVLLNGMLCDPLRLLHLLFRPSGQTH